MKQRLHRSSTEGDDSSDLAGGDNDNADRDGFQKFKVRGGDCWVTVVIPKAVPVGQ